MDQARFRPAQVAASTAAAVGGAYLASGLGVYGTIIGVGVITLISTVGGEMLLLSLERTKQAARTAGPRLRRTGIARTENSGGDADTIEQPATVTPDDPADLTIEQPATAALPDPVAEPDGQRSNARRWWIMAGAALASFGLALAVIVGIETSTGRSLDGEGGPTVLDVFRGTARDSDAPSSPVTPTDEPTGAPEDDGTSPDEPDDATTPQPDPATSSPGSPPPGQDDPPEHDQTTPPPDDDVTPPDDQDEAPPDEEQETNPPPEP